MSSSDNIKSINQLAPLAIRTIASPRSGTPTAIKRNVNGFQSHCES
jgi:hypothetical protein